MADLPKDHPMSAHKDEVGQIMHRWKHHDPRPLHSGRGKGGKEGKVVKSQDQAIAIALSMAGKSKGDKKKTSDHAERFMSLGFSEETSRLVAAMLDDSYDFTTCERPDGSTYGTGGKCRKGTETTEKTKQQMETEKIIESKKKTIAANEAWAKKLRAEGKISEAKAAEEVVEFHRKQMIEAQKLLKNPPKEPKMTVDLNTPAGKWFARRRGYMV